jgi:CheY-like chemotaxis protein
MRADSSVGKSVLIVEGDPGTVAVLARLLGQAGHAVHVAAGGAAALAGSPFSPPPDLVLLGLPLPDMDGAQFRAGQLRDPSLAALPVVVLAAEPRLADGLGAAAVLRKPVEEGDVLAAVERLAAPQDMEVLVVDDDDGVRRLLEVGLPGPGLVVRVAASGAEAVALYREHHRRIGVVLLDVRMPGMDGPQTLAALRQVVPGLRCCFMTGDMGPYSEADLLGRGAALVLPKPLPQLADLRELLRRLAEGQSGES